MSRTAVLTIHIDGAARGNPGPAAFAYTIARDGQLLAEEAGCLGSATNNVAEYTAFVKALQRAAELGGSHLDIRSDSELLVKQMKGEYRVKNPQLRVLYEQARKLYDAFEAIKLQHVPRAENSHADRLCNEALDGVRGPASATVAPPRGPKATGRQAAVREEALACLEAAAQAWSRGDPRQPAVELVWDQLWSIFEENNVLRS
jgi:ribonuclease HI